MNSNAVEFLKTRKFWAPIAALIVSYLFQLAPDLFSGVEYTQEIENAVTIILLVLSSAVVVGDMGYDRIQATALSSAIAEQVDQRLADTLNKVA